MDRMRESLFSILGSIESESFLDLFSGSGLVGIEAASRGAQPVHLVELDRNKKATILKNIAFVQSPIKLFITDAFRFLGSLKQQYDIVYADPPFPLPHKGRIVQMVDSHHALRANGVLIIHYPAEEEQAFDDVYGELKLVDRRSYGRSQLRFYKRETDEHNH
jgi:16S rRNA (guanine(966)-N(2))-methyltransferase RsmD